MDPLAITSLPPCKGRLTVQVESVEELVAKMKEAGVIGA
jgi:hypothetical protein